MQTPWQDPNQNRESGGRRRKRDEGFLGISSYARGRAYDKSSQTYLQKGYQMGCLGANFCVGGIASVEYGS